MRSLDKRDDGYELFEITSFDDLDVTTLLPMIDRAWRADYVDQSRLAFDEAVLRSFAAGRFWVAVLARAADGSPVGFELALQRRLRVGRQTLRAFYASIFTVSADHRRQGLGRWVLEGINRLVFEEREADLIVSAFQAGHAGSPTVQSTFDRIAGWGIVRFHHSPIWARRLDQNLPSPPRPEPSFVRLEQHVEDGPMTVRAADDVRRAPAAPDADELDRLLLSEFETSFALAESLGARYLRPGDEAAGTLLYELGSGRFALLCFSIAPMAKNQRRLQPVGQLQLFLAPGCTESEIESVLRHLALYLARRGCFAVTLVDFGMVPSAVLHHLGFVPTKDRLAFAARGPRRVIETFEHLAPPFFLDFA